MHPHRLLLGAGHSHDHDDDNSSDAFLHGSATDNSLTLRVAAIFVILAASLAGSLPPLFCVQLKPDHWGYRFQRAFGGGVILALALVHVALHAVDELESLTTFPVGGVAILFGVLMMMFLEGLVMIWTGHTHSHLHVEPPVHSIAVKNELAIDDTTQAPALAHFDAHMHVHHAHGDGSNSPRSSVLANQVVAYMMELGCVFHSFIIGLDLGITEGDRSTVIALLIALSFHQMLEGVSLGTVVRAAQFSWKKSVSMVITYSLTTPLGIAVGIGVSGTYDAGTRTATAITGTLSGVSAGILLHIALVQLIAPLFHDRCEGESNRLTLSEHILTTAGLLLGSGFMVMLAVWA